MGEEAALGKGWQAVVRREGLAGNRCAEFHWEKEGLITGKGGPIEKRGGCGTGMKGSRKPGGH